MKYAYFPGCVTPLRENAYELSARNVIAKLGVELVELNESSCCGFFLDAVDHLSSSVLAARNLCTAKEMRCDLLTLCPTCSGHLSRIRMELLADPKLRNNVNAILSKIDRKFDGSVEVKHLTKMLIEDVGISRIRRSVVRPLGLKIAPHYGCHIMKPSDQLHFDNPESPHLLDSLVEATGVECVDYLEKKLCCGAPLMGVNETLSLRILREKVRSISLTGAEAIVTICPFCHTHFDLNQMRLGEDQGGKGFPALPVFHYTQILGLAQGYDPDDLGLYENRVPVDGLLNTM